MSAPGATLAPSPPDERATIVGGAAAGPSSPGDDVAACEAAAVDQVFKILVTGPFAAGKTSLIRSVSQTEVVSTDVGTSGDESAVKGETTVAMDFGTYRVDDEAIELLLFGTPGQPRFRFMTDVLKGEVDVVAFVVDGEARGTHAPAGVELRALLADLRVPAVVAVNRCDDPELARRIARSLGTPPTTPVVPCQLVDPESGRDVVVEILLTLLDELDEPGDGPADVERGGDHDARNDARHDEHPAGAVAVAGGR